MYHHLIIFYTYITMALSFWRLQVTKKLKLKLSSLKDSLLWSCFYCCDSYDNSFLYHYFFFLHNTTSNRPWHDQHISKSLFAPEVEVYLGSGKLRAFPAIFVICVDIKLWSNSKIQKRQRWLRKVEGDVCLTNCNL